MAFIHDRIESAGHEVDYFCADDVPPAWAGWWGRRVGVSDGRSRASRRSRSGVGRPYDIVNVHEPSAAPVLIGRRAHAAPVVDDHAMASSGARGSLRRRKAVSVVKDQAGERGSRIRPLRCGLATSRSDVRITCLCRQRATTGRHLISDLAPRTGHASPACSPAPTRSTPWQPSSATTLVRPACCSPGTWRKNKGIEDLVPAFVALGRTSR